MNAPYLLLVLDGWGHRDAAPDNAISVADTPVWDHLWAERPRTLIATSGAAVGLPPGQMGNSEVGHMNLGAGRVVHQDYTRVAQAVADGTLADNPALAATVAALRDSGGALHLLGLLSPGGVHSHEQQLFALADAAAALGAEKIYLHAFLDGRDTPPRSAAASLRAAEQRLGACGGRVASLIGRYYAMDRDRRWDRVEAAYRLLTEGVAVRRAANAGDALAAAYADDESDEFVRASAVIPDEAEPAVIADGDAVLFANFRADRARQLTRAFVDDGFDGFERRRRPGLAAFAALTEYYAGLPAEVLFPPLSLDDGLGDVVAKAGLRQLRIAETEKYAHVTFFFNGGHEEPLAGEQRVLVPSPQVATYDLAPAMSADELTDRLVDAIDNGGYGLIVCNYANPDMVGHTGKLDAAIAAAEVVDRCLGRITDALQRVGGAMLLTADHGNLENMRDPDSGQAHTAHTTNPVPLLYVGPGTPAFVDGGALCDVAPTLLALMGLEQPAAMSGRSLLAAR